ncbi:MAG: DUF4230 domain-containing protein [Bacteroidota bacterium]|nr:DUF4230 domain-containing protein [Bacteroidota bacterium]
MRRTPKILFSILIIFAAYLVLTKMVVPGMKKIFSSEPVAIDETPILIKEIKSIGQLISYTSYDEVVADTTIKTKGSAFVNGFNRLAHIPLLPSADKQLVLIGRGKVLAGTNLSLLTDTSVSIKNDTLRMYLPKAQILDAIINPSDFETFVERGEWSNEEVILVKASARRKMIENALQQEIIPKADAKSKATMENFLHNMGYKYVLIF